MSRSKRLGTLKKCAKKVFGENYAQELAEKAGQLPEDIEWHMIGNVQRSNVKHVIKAHNLVVETIDSEKVRALLFDVRRAHTRSHLITQIATKYNELLAAANRKVRVFLQVNTSGEESKSGCAPGDLIALSKFVRDKCPALQLSGLMTIGKPDSVDDFVRLVELRTAVAKELQVPLNSLELSMGMSADFAKAITYGSTNIRVGSKIFGERH